MTPARQKRFSIYRMRGLEGPLVVSLGYFLGAEAAFFIGTLSDNFFAPFWPPNVVLFCALAFAPYSRWWIYLAAVLPIHIIVEWQVAMPPPQIAVAFLTNCAVAILNALIVKQLLVSPPWLDSFRRALVYVIGTAGISPAVVAFGGAFVRIIVEGQMHAYWIYWMQWYVANALASLTLGPILLVVVDRVIGLTPRISRRHMTEAAILGAALASTCALVLKMGTTGSFASFLPVLLYLPLPLVLWSALRFGITGASSAILLVTMVSVGMTVEGVTIFGHADAEMNVLALQLYLTGFAVPVLLLGASIEGLHEVERTTSHLAQTLIASHDEERRRTAKELHEGVCQELAAASLGASRMVELLPADLQHNARQIEGMLRKAINDLRSASYLLHPPLLDESGLEPALRSFTESFRRSKGIAVDLAVSPDLGRLTSDIEIAVFRFVEEALRDISRHAASATVGICVNRCGPNVIVTVVRGGETGKRSFSSLLRRVTSITHAEHSLGLAGMRARLQRIGGELQLDPLGGTTSLKAIIRARRKPVEEGANMPEQRA